MFPPVGRLPSLSKDTNLSPIDGLGDEASGGGGGARVGRGISKTAARASNVGRGVLPDERGGVTQNAVGTVEPERGVKLGHTSFGRGGVSNGPVRW